MGGHFLHLRMIIRPQHDRIDHPAQHARGIGHAFAPTQLAGARIHDQRATAQLADRHVETDPRAGTAFLEHHGQRAPGQRGVRISRAARHIRARRLAILRIVQHRGDCVAASIGQVEEMADRHAASGW